MPELPEVETVRRGIEPHVVGQTIETVIVRERRLRWPVPARLGTALRGQIVTGVGRRGKYLLLSVPTGTLLMHLGMSGSLRNVDASSPPGPHDHLDLVFDDGRALRLTDPRRFGSVHFTKRPPQQHRLLRDLGPEPLSGDFSGAYLHERARGRRAPVKQFIMDGKVVVGIGNIYASESLFEAGIHPARAAGRVSARRYARLAAVIKVVLARAIRAGGTTLRDFTGSDGRPGYFRIRLRVYGREGEPCPRCETPIRSVVIGQRSSFYCPACQR